MAHGALLLKERNGFSDDDVVAHLAMNPSFQYFIGLREYWYEAPFDARMMTRFRQRITSEMLLWINDQIIGRADEKPEDKNHNDGNGGAGSAKGDSGQITRRMKTF